MHSDAGSLVHCCVCALVRNVLFNSPYYLTTVTALTILVLAPVVHKTIPLLLGACCPHLVSDWNKRMRDLVVKFVAIFMTIFYPAISLKSLSLWNCIAVGAWNFVMCMCAPFGTLSTLGVLILGPSSDL